ncbi:hypothetical protein QVD17_18497 [Tagetes erecta]|uniref:Uncharacterized protein n=1 Tax=Tagetes erecta TaxID=13708 RepID=A0AAD8KKQ8_TARER|nr:hypothetical protein QVD17_18497 [Tagetes erecta]
MTEIGAVSRDALAPWSQPISENPLVRLPEDNHPITSYPTEALIAPPKRRKPTNVGASAAMLFLVRFIPQFNNSIGASDKS